MTLRSDPPVAPSSSRGRRALFWTGAAMVAAGLALLGYVAWELFGTNIVAHHKQETLVEQLRDGWRSDVGASAETGGIEIGEASALVRIPRFGSKYVMPVLEGTADDALSQGLGHFDGSAGPGRRGNYALAGHRVTHGEPLSHMPDLRPGDEVTVETRRAMYTYVIDTDPNQLIVPFTATWVIDPFPANPEGGVAPDPADGDKLLTLTTCSEVFHTDDRMIAFGHLASVDRK